MKTIIWCHLIPLYFFVPNTDVLIAQALQFWRARGVEGRTKMLTVCGGYHGDTFGAMAVCDPDNGMHAAMFAGCLKVHQIPGLY